MGEVAIVLTPEAEEVSTQALTIPEKANAITITSAEDYIKAGEFWKAIKELRDKVAKTFDPIIKKAHEAHKEAVAKKKEVDAPLEGAQKTVKGIMEIYDREQERIRQAEQRRLEEIARREEEERRLAEAIAAEEAMKAQGMTKEEAAKEATAIIEEPVSVAPVVVAKAVPKMQGGPVYRTIWKYRIKDVNKIPRDYMIPDEVKIGQLVRALKKQTNIPGIEVYEERV
jgi:transcriptional regulator of heat shock response